MGLGFEIVDRTMRFVIGLDHEFPEDSRPEENKELFHRRYWVGKDLEDMHLERRRGVEVATAIASETELSERTRELLKQNLFVGGDAIFRERSKYVDIGMIPLTFSVFSPVTLPAFAGVGAVAGYARYGPSIHDQALTFFPQAVGSVSLGAAAGLLTLAAINRAGLALTSYGHRVGELRCAERLPEQEVLFKESLERYLKGPHEDSEFSRHAESLAEKLREPVLVSHNRYDEKVFERYADAKRSHPGGIYQLV